MKETVPLLQLIAHGVLNAGGGGNVGDAAPAVAEDVWNAWSRQGSPAQLRKEVEAVANLTNAKARELAERVAAEAARGRPASVRQALATYLALVPSAIRQSQRRPEDPSGRTAPPGSSLKQAADLLPFLPARLPRFAPGSRPPGIGDWELQELLGAGGFGEVWKARNPFRPNSPPVALKFCLDAEAAKALRNEVRLLDHVESAGRHPGIVSLLRTHLGAEPPCLEYEFVEGGDLTNRILEWNRDGKGPSPREAARVILGLAEIVAFAHRLHPPIIHRDLKPANVLVTGTGDGVPQFKIADFGIGGFAAGQALRRNQTSSGGSNRSLATVARGAYTPLFASPQQMAGAAADPRDDVHALGVIWYQLLTGDLSSGPPSGLGWIDKLLRRGMNQKQVRLLASCFDTLAEKRPADAGVLAQRLRELFEDPVPTPPAKRPPSLPAVPPPIPIALPSKRPPSLPAVPPPIPIELPPERLPRAANVAVPRPRPEKPPTRPATPKPGRAGRRAAIGALIALPFLVLLLVLSLASGFGWLGSLSPTPLVPTTKKAAENPYAKKPLETEKGNESVEKAPEEKEKGKAPPHITVDRPVDPGPVEIDPAKEMQGVLDEIGLPPVVGSEDNGVASFGVLPPFGPATMAAYAAGGPDTALRKEIRSAQVLLWAVSNAHEPTALEGPVNLVKALIGRNQAVLKDGYRAPQNEAQFKTQVEADQRQAAVLLESLQERLEALKAAGDKGRAAETRRWQANYDYTLARLEMQIAFVYEYESMLGQLRKELPPLPPGNGGWKLAAQPTLQGDSAGKKMAKDARKILDKLATECAGTPWELLARREQLVPLGLEWRAVP